MSNLVGLGVVHILQAKLLFCFWFRVWENISFKKKSDSFILMLTVLSVGWYVGIIELKGPVVVGKHNPTTKKVRFVLQEPLYFPSLY